MSNKYELDKIDWMKIQTNFLIFVSPILMIYLGSMSTVLSEPGYVFSWYDLIPNPLLVGMMVKQLIDTTIDVLRKWSGGDTIQVSVPTVTVTTTETPTMTMTTSETPTTTIIDERE